MAILGPNGQKYISSGKKYTNHSYLHIFFERSPVYNPSNMSI